MLEANQNNQTNNSSDNILLSLEYLKEEAKREGKLELYKILDTASILGRSVSFQPSDQQESYGIDKDLFHAAMFLLKFLNSSEFSKETVINILDKKH